MRTVRLIFIGYLLVILSLFLYSYTQVDLSLTLSRASIYQTIEKGFQYIGYFNRPLSTELYCAILILLFLFYSLFLFLAKKSQITLKNTWKIILITAGILTFSYNAFSYDLFNYIFAAKLIFHYHQNPYLVHALDFPKDPMLSFMHWTHNTYQYGPFALFITLPFYILGFGYFLLTFYLFKILSTACFIGSVYFLQKILQKVNPAHEILGTILYALNPLVLIELVVSAHNDGIMMFLALMGIYFVLKKQWVWGVMALIASALTKEVTVLLFLPAVILFVQQFFKKKFFSDTLFLYSCIGVMVLGYVYAIHQLGIQPWYIIWVLPFVFIVKIPKVLLAGTIGYCLGMLLRYVPFLWQGDWNGMAPTIMTNVTIITPIVFVAGFGAYSLFHHYAKR